MDQYSADEVDVGAPPVTLQADHQAFCQAYASVSFPEMSYITYIGCNSLFPMPVECPDFACSPINSSPYCACSPGYYVYGPPSYKCTLYPYNRQPLVPEVFTCQRCPPEQYCKGWIISTSTNAFAHVMPAACSSKCQPGTRMTRACNYLGLDSMCQPCPAGTFSSTWDAPSCQPCSVTQCKAGEYMRTECRLGDIDCTACCAGKYLPWPNTCTECIPCKDCTILQYVKQNCTSIQLRLCEDCPAGTYRNLNPNSYQCPTCSACAAGKFQTSDCYTHDDLQCSLCPSNTYTSFATGGGVTQGADACNACSTGTFSPPGATECRSCNPGQRWDLSLHVCVACLPGMFFLGLSHEVCVACLPGIVFLGLSHEVCVGCFLHITITITITITIMVTVTASKAPPSMNMTHK